MSFQPSSWIWRIALACFVALLFLFQLGSREMWASHEARAAQNAQRMVDDDSWGLPHLYDGQVEYQKPPGYYWLTAILARLTNDDVVDAWIVRLPSAMSGLLTVAVIFCFLWKLGRRGEAFIAAVVLATAVHFTAIARTGRIDMPLTAAVTAAVLLGWRTASTGDRPSIGRSAALGSVLGIALLLKGLIGFSLPLAVLGGVWLIESRHRDRRFALPIGRLGIAVVVAVAVAAPWYLWANAATDGEFFRVFFVYHHFNRAFGGADALAGHPWWYYLPRFAADFLPWTPMIAIALFRRKWTGSDALTRLSLVWFVSIFVVLSCSRFKRADYLLPAYPGAAMLVGCIATRWYSSLTTRCQRRIVTVLVPTFLLGTFAAWWVFENHITPHVGVSREQKPFAELIRRHAPRPQSVLLFRVESHLLAYHLGRPLHTLVEWAELNERLVPPGTHYFVTRAEFVPECLQYVHSRRIALVARSEDVCRERPDRPLVLMRTEVDPAAPEIITGASLSAWLTHPPRD